MNPMRFISIFLPPLWLECLEYFVSIFFSKHHSQQANPSFLESHLKRKQGDLSILTYEFLWILGVFEDFILLPGRKHFPR